MLSLITSNLSHIQKKSAMLNSAEDLLAATAVSMKDRRTCRRKNSTVHSEWLPNGAWAAGVYLENLLRSRNSSQRIVSETQSLFLDFLATAIQAVFMVVRFKTY